MTTLKKSAQPQSVKRKSISRQPEAKRAGYNYYSPASKAEILVHLLEVCGSVTNWGGGEQYDIIQGSMLSFGHQGLQMDAERLRRDGEQTRQDMVRAARQSHIEVIRRLLGLSKPE